MESCTYLGFATNPCWEQHLMRAPVQNHLRIWVSAQNRWYWSLRVTDYSYGSMPRYWHDYEYLWAFLCCHESLRGVHVAYESLCEKIIGYESVRGDHYGGESLRCIFVCFCCKCASRTKDVWLQNPTAREMFAEELNAKVMFVMISAQDSFLLSIIVGKAHHCYESPCCIRYCFGSLN